jgi:23S rRNA (adenine2503-C2)-methyltransferase
MKNEVKSFIDFSSSEIHKALSECGADSYRLNQINDWIYSKYVQKWEDMANLPKDLLMKLSTLAPLHPLEEINCSGLGSDPTQKFLFLTSKKNKIESVLMRQGSRVTVCISSQSGCAVDCDFCATASMGFKQNLSTGEIVDQVLQLSNRSSLKITNVVFMGMGEPFLNYQKVVEAAKIMNEKMNLGSRRITISTAGIVSKIYQMADDKLPFKLAVSLNAPNDEIRKVIMPLTITNPINELLKAAEYYYSKLRRFITFEYVLLENVNSDEKCARQLIHLLKNIPCKVNLIPYNEIESEYKRPSNISINNFERILKEAPFTTTVRWSKGTNIDAGCGQLAVRV